MHFLGELEDIIRKNDVDLALCKCRDKTKTRPTVVPSQGSGSPLGDIGNQAVSGSSGSVSQSDSPATNLLAVRYSSRLFLHLTAAYRVSKD